jgi:hypothetical protein
MMNYPEYKQAVEYRDRLLKLLETGRSTLPPVGFKSFSYSISGKVQKLEKELADFQKSSCGSMCSWMGLPLRTSKVFNVTAQITQDASSSSLNVRWNSPAESALPIPATIGASQSSFLRDDDEIPLVLEPA